MTLGVGRANDRCTFMISNRSVSRLKTPVLRTARFPMKGDLSRLSYVHIWPVPGRRGRRLIPLRL